MRGDPVSGLGTGVRLLVIVGPTAIGKTGLAVEIARHLPAEAVSADSRQIYRYMDIGTAKATPEERALLPHHLVDVVNPGEPLTLAQYLEQAKCAIVDIHTRGKMPMLVGGTGLYVRALLEGWTVPRVAPDLGFRAAMATLAERDGSEALWQRLATVDPAAAEGIDHRNIRRVIRALEVHHATGQPISELQRKRPPGYDAWTIGLTGPREWLYERIDARIEWMLRAGLEREVRGLLDQGYGRDLPSMSGLGYQQMASFVAGEVSLAEAVQQIKRDTRRFVRQQYNWFRLSAEWITWYDVTVTAREEIVAAACAFGRTGAHGEKAQG